MGRIMASAYGNRIVIQDADLTRWLTDDVYRELEVISEGPGLDEAGWPLAARATEILTAHGWRVVTTWDRQWDNSRGEANGTLERDPGYLFVTVARADA